MPSLPEQQMAGSRSREQDPAGVLTADLSNGQAATASASAAADSGCGSGSRSVTAAMTAPAAATTAAPRNTAE